MVGEARVFRDGAEEQNKVSSRQVRRDEMTLTSSDGLRLSNDLARSPSSALRRGVITGRFQTTLNSFFYMMRICDLRRQLLIQ